jgi:hypothetical protein
MGDIFKALTKIRSYFFFKIEWVFKKRILYTPLEDKEYFKRFGIKKIEDKFEIEDKCLLEKAYIKAWENRNFEIDKFWTRAAYFWGFIVLIFGGYISLLTSDHSQKAIAMKIDLYLLLLGFLFSLSWYLVIRGSKCWQENWEAHIDKLEDLVSGPLYKTIHYSGHRYYSVSKLNEIMALVVFLVWSCLLIQYMYNNLEFTWQKLVVDFQVTVPILVTLIFAFVLRFGYCLGDYKTDKYKFFDRRDRAAS